MQRLATTAGSIVRVAFNATRERALFIDATDALGKPLPFAARIEDETCRSYGAVGQRGVGHAGTRRDHLEALDSSVVDQAAAHAARNCYVMNSLVVVTAGTREIWAEVCSGRLSILVLSFGRTLNGRCRPTVLGKPVGPWFEGGSQALLK